MTNMKKLLIATAITSALTACGGGSVGSSSPALNLNGKVIDGYITGATVFLDLNFNGLLDSSEPSAVTEIEGDFILGVPDHIAKCAQYVPVVVDVPVGAIDSDSPETPIEEAYTMVYPPQFALTSDQDLLNLTPLTTVVWSQVKSELLNNETGVLTCESILAGEDLRQSIRQRLKDQERRVAARYNATVDELYGDYIESQNTALHQMAKDIVPGLQRSYEETSELISANPDAEFAWVQFFLGAWDSQEKDLGDGWYREQFVQVSDGNFDSTIHEMSDDLETKLTLFRKSGMEMTQRDGVNIMATLQAEKNDSNYSCAMSEWIETMRDDSSGVRNTIYSTVASHEECQPGSHVGFATQALLTKNFVNGELISYTEHTYYEDNDSGFRHLIGVTDTITQEDLIPVRSVIDTDFDSEAGHGADYWARTESDKIEGGSTMTIHDSDGYWQKLTNYDDGIHKKECGYSKYELSEGKCR